MVKEFRGTLRAVILKQMEADNEVALYVDKIRDLPWAWVLEKRARVRNKSCRACGKLLGNHSPEELAICTRQGRRSR